LWIEGIADRVRCRQGSSQQKLFSILQQPKLPAAAQTKELQTIPDVFKNDVHNEESIELIFSPDQKLEQAINADPGAINGYIELAKLFANDAEFREAEVVIMRGIENRCERHELRHYLSEIHSLRLQKEAAIAAARQSRI
jgi:hypothetical protein